MNTFKIGEVNFCFLDMYHQLGIAWTDDNGKRKSVRFKLPEELALRLFQEDHPGLKDFSED